MPELIHGHEWARGPRTRVVVEATEWRRREQLSSALRAQGYDTVACPGPEGAGDRCALAAGQGCRAAEEADVVVHVLGAWDLRNAEVLRALRSRLPGPAIVVEVAAPDLERGRDELEGCVLVESPAGPTDVVEAVSVALRTRSEGEHG